MYRLFKKEGEGFEHCYYVETSEQLNEPELKILKHVLAQGFDENTISLQSFLVEEDVVEIGPRLNFATAFHTNVLSICRDVLLTKVTRIERSRRMVFEPGQEYPYDRMTECFYPKPLESFETGITPNSVETFDLIGKGPDVLKIQEFAMDDWDRDFYYKTFVETFGRNPTDVEMYDLNNANSEHSRHGYFKGKQIHDGIIKPFTLMQLVQSTLEENGDNSVLAFCDNSSGMKGFKVETIVPENPGRSSSFVQKTLYYDIIFTAETHNFPTGIAPVPGAETGTGGRIRDIQATGKGGLVIAGTTGYCVGHLFIPGYELSWENPEDVYPSNLATSLAVLIGASNGAFDYGNKFGEPVIAGFTRSFDQRLPFSGERWGWGKKIMFTGGIGQIDSRHIKKGHAEKGLVIVQVGGPAYRIGVGGGAASSMLQGENDEALDFNAVQRGDAEMEQKMNRVIRACSEMGENNPIVSVHDQGAGGPANVLKELVEKSGGRIELRRITVGDPTLSVREIWIAEYQERNGFLIHPDRYGEFEAICMREKVNCERLGEVTGDGRFVVHDELDDTTPVDLELDAVLGNMPQKAFCDSKKEQLLPSLDIPWGVSIIDALKLVFKNIAVGSKRFLTNKVDRSVTGLIAQQQCCGPMQLPVADYGLVAQSHFGFTGAATSIGEQPIKMLIDPAAGARMAVGEALTNIVWVKLLGTSNIKCSANWMWAPKLPGEGVAMYEAAEAMTDLMKDLGIAVDGGKDSLSMALKDGNELIKSPRELVISAYCTVPDIRKKVTPDFKKPGYSIILHIDLANGKRRLGGSVLAQVFKQLGNDCPDVEDSVRLSLALDTVQELIEEGLILAGHDISDGGLITALSEMAFAGNCGFTVDINSESSVMEALFAEELGLLIEVNYRNLYRVISMLAKRHIKADIIGNTTKVKNLSFRVNSQSMIVDMEEARSWWEETSYQIERLRNSACADEEKRAIYSRRNPQYFASFNSKASKQFSFEERGERYPIAILREEGSNGDREMTSAFYMAGFQPHDVNMWDIVNGKVDLRDFRGLAAVGGFSYADYPASAKGWASVIRENPVVSKQFKDFYDRPDTFSVGICNGCQLFAWIGWVPWYGIPDADQPRFVRNKSGRFESRWSSVRIVSSPSIMMKDMAGSILGIHVAHGEGRLVFPNEEIRRQVIDKSLISLAFCDDFGNVTDTYPFNPNGSERGITGICTPDGRHLALMPHPERAFLKWQWDYLPKNLDQIWQASPWLQMFMNAYDWCVQNKK